MLSFPKYPNSGRMFGTQKCVTFCVDLEAEYCSKWRGFWASVSFGGKNLSQKEDMFGRRVLLLKIYRLQDVHRGRICEQGRKEIKRTENGIKDTPDSDAGIEPQAVVAAHDSWLCAAHQARFAALLIFGERAFDWMRLRFACLGNAYMYRLGKSVPVTMLCVGGRRERRVREKEEEDEDEE
ncbi:hypothetical protein B0H19DRAFT_1075762 [Mycena capillaripes]|nr:hypothetical protein B0H19DRAFT_1075762 [Mycena capillaripes]